MKNNKWVLSAAASAILAVLAMPAVEQTVFAASTAAEVKIDNFSFTPPIITVKAGTPITWTNGDDIPHNVVSEDHSFKSKVLDTDEKFTFTINKPGTYSYFCAIHPKMTGKVVVE
jgi:plastocyanin